MITTDVAEPASGGGTGHGRWATPGFLATLASEWRKFWSLPVTRTVLVATAAVTVGVSGLIALFGGGDNLARVQNEGEYGVIFFSSLLGVWAFIYLGANFVASEFRTGLADYTFVATPRRARVMFAKLIVIGGLGLAIGGVISVVNVAITQGALALGGFPTLRLDDPGLVRAILIYIGVGMCFQGMIGSLLAVLVRNAFGAMVLTVLFSALPVMLAKFFGAAYAHTVPRWTPGALVESLAGVSKPGSDGYLPTSLALLAAGVWIGVLGFFAISRVLRADAR